MIVMAAYDPSWPAQFAALAGRIRAALGPVALAIHHIGSTAVPGLRAKDVIDLQVTVAELDAPIQAALERIGFTLGAPRCDHSPPGLDLPPAELEKRFYKKADRPANLHIRVAGRFNQRYPLLCRDYLRAEPRAADAYGEIKRQLVRRFAHDVDVYYDIKDPVFDVIMAAAAQWAARTGWTPPASDA
ncbi:MULTISPECIES: GrpB family protein [unclassified Inquilinus]|uniref:GrpB family protein n=1 Tax=unclassified Inquilinus TaxID=2645927 RepID=UPI003F90043C